MIVVGFAQHTRHTRKYTPPYRVCFFFKNIHVCVCFCKILRPVQKIFFAYVRGVCYCVCSTCHTKMTKHTRRGRHTRMTATRLLFVYLKLYKHDIQ